MSEEPTSPVGTFAAPRAPDPVRGGLSRPDPPLSPTFRRRRVTPVLLWGSFLGGAGLLVSGAAPMWAVLGGMGSFAVARSVWQGWRTVRWKQQLQRAFTHLQEREIDLAEEQFLRAARSATTAAEHAVATLHAGRVSTLQGDLGEALRRGAVAANSTALAETDAATSAYAMSWVALCYALLGDLEAASGWVARARRAQERLRPLLHHVDFAEAVLRCRQGRFQEAIELLRDAHAELAATLTAAEMSQVRLVEAFCLHHLGGRGADVLVAAELPNPADVRALVQQWTQMRAFLLEYAPPEANLLD